MVSLLYSHPTGNHVPNGWPLQAAPPVSCGRFVQSSCMHDSWHNCWLSHSGPLAAWHHTFVPFFVLDAQNVDMCPRFSLSSIANRVIVTSFLDCCSNKSQLQVICQRTAEGPSFAATEFTEPYHLWFWYLLTMSDTNKKTKEHVGSCLDNSMWCNWLWICWR